MPAHSGPVTAVMILLFVAGIQKILDPSTASGALRAAGLPHRPFLVRLLGLVEVGAGMAFLVWGGWLPSLIGAVLYAGFAWFVINALVRRLPLASCGCLGSAETPPTMVHVVVNFAALSILVAAVLVPIGPMGGLVGAEWTVVVPYLVFLGASVYMLYALLSVLPLVLRVRSETSSTPTMLTLNTKGRA